jgi:dihydrofolate synthase/folylpolyglutamate synthase
MQSQHAWLTWLERRFEQRPIQLGLDRVRPVAQRLGIQRLEVPVITVAGTNGKGSTVQALQAIYQQAGYRVGVYTSPHLIEFNERIQINGQPISETDLCTCFEYVHAEEQAHILTYFEFTTLAALLYFQSQNLDLIILEVGMGGRLDATNIVDATLAVITTIDFDHQAFLGETLEAIGQEKAGIFRPHQSAIFASRTMPASIERKARDLDIKLQQLGRTYEMTYDPHSKLMRFETPDFSWQGDVFFLHPEATGAALMATRLMQRFLPISEDSYHALKHAALPGRLQQLKGSPHVLLDVAHNQQSVERLKQFLRTHHPHQRMHMVFSALADKPVQAMMSCLDDRVTSWHIGLLEGYRSLSLEDWQENCSCFEQNKIVWYHDVPKAFEGSVQYAGEDDMIVVFGSFFTVAAVMNHIKVKNLAFLQ